MRTVNSHLLVEKMDEAVTHYINTQPPNEHVDTGALSLNIQEEGGSRVIALMHPSSFSSQMCRQIQVSEPVEGQWGEELLDAEGRIAALAAHLAQHTRIHHQPVAHHKAVLSRNDVDSNVMLDRLTYNGHTLQDQQNDMAVQVSSLPPLPLLANMKRCDNGDWFSKSKDSLKNDPQLIEDTDSVLDIGAGASPAQNKQSKKSLPHKKRISKKLKRNAGNSTPQQNMVVLTCHDNVPQEEILPDNYVTVQHPEQMPEETHHITNEVRPLFICQLCGEYYGDEQLKFYQHLKQHYEPPPTIIIENPVNDLGIDKMTNTCIVDNVTLPDSIVELSLENTMPKVTMYQPMEKHILYTSSDKITYSGKLQYSIANSEKDLAHDLHGKDLCDHSDKNGLYSCTKCNKNFRKQKHCEAHVREAHKLEEINEFSEPEDLMEGIHVSVEDGEHYDGALLPHLTVDAGHIHTDSNIMYKYISRLNNSQSAALQCGPESTYPICSNTRDTQLKEEVFQRMFENEINETVTNDNQFANDPGELLTESQPANDTEPPEKTEVTTEDDTISPRIKRFHCNLCDRIFKHRNSLMYHVLAHQNMRPHECNVCSKAFYTSTALKIHYRVHDGVKPYKCDECGRDFRQWGDLRYHVISLHTDVKQYKCEFCGKEFSRKYSLIVHRRIHTGEKNYKCDYCNKSFRASSYRLAHMKTHTGDKPHKCMLCLKSFRNRFDLRRHSKIHNKQINKVEKPEKPKEKQKIVVIHEPEDIEKDQIKKELIETVATKKNQKPKKTNNKKAPNVTINTRSSIKRIETMQHNKLKESLYEESEPINEQYKPRTEFKVEKDFLQTKQFKQNHTGGDKIVYLNRDSDKLVLNRGKDTVNPQTDLKVADLKERSDVNSDSIENGFFERLSAFYNIPAV